MGPSYAVVWREDEGPVFAGRLGLQNGSLLLEGSGSAGALARREIRYDDLAAVRIGREPAERVSGRPSLVLDRHVGPSIHIGEIGGSGLVFEVADVLAELVSEQPSGSRVAVVLPLKPGSREFASKLLQDGPPFDPGATSLSRHQVFITDREVIFIFEGSDVERAVEQLARKPSTWKAAAAWKDCLGGRPRRAELGYSWARGRRAMG